GAVEIDRGVNLLELDLDADLRELFLDHGLCLLTDGVDRRGENEAQLQVVLLADVALHDPASVVEDAGGLLEIVFPRGVGAVEGLEAGQDVRGGGLALPVEALGNEVTRNGERDRLANGLVGQGRVRRVHLGALAVDLGPGVGELEVEALDRRATLDDDFAGGVVGYEAVEDLRLDLQVPGVVVLAGLEDGARRRGRIAATLDDDAGEGGLVRLAVALVGDEDGLVVRRELLDHERAGADRAHHELVVLRGIRDVATP